MKKRINQPVNAINALGAISARIAIAFVDINLAVKARSTGSTTTLISVDEIFAVASVLTWVRHTFIKLNLAQIAGEARLAGASEGVLTVDTFSAIARR